jgi:glutaredoxin-like YruB-family protein
MNHEISQITNRKDFDRLLSTHPSFLAVAFVKDSSDRSVEALRMLEKIQSDTDSDTLALVDVSKNRDIHSRFGVSKVPTIITLKEGKLQKKLEGLQAEETYRVLLANAPRKRADGTEAPPLRVVVYTTRTCPHCTTVKSHLRRKGIPYREVDVSRDPDAATELTRRTGQTGVPQTDINGTFVLGADLPKINRLIGIN